MFGGTAIDCVFTNNRSGARGAALSDSLAINCLITQNDVASVLAVGGSDY